MGLQPVFEWKDLAAGATDMVMDITLVIRECFLVLEGSAVMTAVAMASGTLMVVHGQRILESTVSRVAWAWRTEKIPLSMSSLRTF